MSQTPGQVLPTAPSPSTRREDRLAWLDALRGFAALCVVFDHGSTLVLMPVRDYLYRWFNFGQFGVFVFFLVSGYIVPASLERRGSLRKFWIGRGFRLYPMFAVALVLAMVGYVTRYGTLGGAEHDPQSALAAWVLMLQNLLPGYNVPNVTWTLSYEMLFYLLLAGLFSYGVHKRSVTYAFACAAGAVVLGGVLPMAVFVRWAGPSGHGGFILNVTVDVLILGGVALSVFARGTWAIRVGASVAALTVLVLATFDQTYPYPWSATTILALMFTGTVIYRAEQFSSGGATPRSPRGLPATGPMAEAASVSGLSRASGRLRDLVTPPVQAAIVVVAVLALTVYAGVWHGQQQHQSHVWQVQWVTSVAGAFVVFGIGFAARHRRVPRWFAWLGLISYSVYLLHPLVFNAYRAAYGPVPFFRHSHSIGVQVLLFAGLVGVIIALSAVTYYLVEKPMQRLGRQVATRFPAAAPATSLSVPPAPYATVAGAGAGTDGGGASAADGATVPDTASERDGTSTRDGAADAAARSASSSSAVAGGSGASP